MDEEIKVGYFIMKPVETQEQCDQYSVMATQLNAHNSVAAPGDALWAIDDKEDRYEIIESGTVPTVEEALEPQKEYKISESKTTLSEYLASHPLQWTDGKYYSVTSEKQALLTSNLSLYQLAVSNGQTFQLKWNTTGNEFEFSRFRIDCVEWRVDRFEQCMDAHSVVSCLQKLRVALRDKLLLVTFRTKAEGGKVSLTHKEYLDFINTVIDTDCADLIDIEFFTAGDDIRELIDNAHSSGVVVVCSSHDFQKTPDKNELVSRMVKMQQVGADLPKVAVMPHDSTDVLTLLSATIEMKNKYFVTPVITISMGKLGVASRLCGEVFGSAMTFASAGDSSAPGQISIDVVNAVLDSITE